MATYAILANFTHKGITNITQTVERADAFKHLAEKSGGSVKEIYWTMGSRDVIVILDAPDDETATALSLSVGLRGNVCSETLRAFSFDEMKQILGNLV